MIGIINLEEIVEKLLKTDEVQHELCSSLHYLRLNSNKREPVIFLHKNDPYNWITRLTNLDKIIIPEEEFLFKEMMSEGCPKILIRRQRNKNNDYKTIFETQFICINPFRKKRHPSPELDLKLKREAKALFKSLPKYSSITNQVFKNLIITIQDIAKRGYAINAKYVSYLNYYEGYYIIKSMGEDEGNNLTIPTEEILLEGSIMAHLIITNLLVKEKLRNKYRQEKLYFGLSYNNIIFPPSSRAEITYSDENLCLINVMPFPKIDRYRITKLIGQGSYKQVYYSKDDNLDHSVAVKTIHIPTLATQPNVQRAIKAKLGDKFNENIETALIKIFQEEAQLMLKITTTRSKNISQIYNAYFDKDSKTYVIIEELGDQTLADILAENKRINHMTSSFYLKQIVEGIEQLHTLGYVHGDLKPENILINKDGTVRITDFGWSSQIPLLSQHYEDPRYLTNLLTCAPEVFDGKHPTKESDMWSVGVIAYRMILGEWPFHHGFTGTEQEWKVLPAEKKKEYARKIREQMTEERIKEIQNRLNRLRFTTRSDDSRVMLTPQKLLFLDPTERYPIDISMSLPYEDIV